jgi:hypothetical protein
VGHDGSESDAALPPTSASGEDAEAVDPVEQAMEDAIATAIAKLQDDGADSATYQYFAPRRLGATAPHSCTIWDVDYRAPSDASAKHDDRPSEMRHIGDAGLTTQIDRLLKAGLRVPRDTR